MKQKKFFSFRSKYERRIHFFHSFESINRLIRPSHTHTEREVFFCVRWHEIFIFFFTDVIFETIFFCFDKKTTNKKRKNQNIYCVIDLIFFYFIYLYSSYSFILFIYSTIERTNEKFIFWGWMKKKSSIWLKWGDSLRLSLFFYHSSLFFLVGRCLYTSSLFDDDKTCLGRNSLKAISKISNVFSFIHS